MTSWNHAKLVTLAAGWFEEIRSRDRNEKATDVHADAVVLMNFTASNETQWDFIQIGVAMAASESELFSLAAGPFEHLMASYSETYIERVELNANSCSHFRKMVSASWRHNMSDKVWARVKAIQATAQTTP